MSTPRAETSSLTSSKVIDKYADILSLVQDVSDGGISREEVLRRGIPWDSIAPMMTEKELEAVKKYDKKVSERAALLEKVLEDLFSVRSDKIKRSDKRSFLFGFRMAIPMRKFL
jgi:hypothetical protein